MTTEFSSVIHIKKSPNLDINSELGSLHHVDVVSNAYLLGVYTDSIFRVKVRRVDQCSCTYRFCPRNPRWGKVGAGTWSGPIWGADRNKLANMTFLCQGMHTIKPYFVM
jgi:hypothetical protein